MFLSGSHAGLTSKQADDLQQDLQARADFEHAKITFSRSGADDAVTLTWTVVLPPGALPPVKPIVAPNGVADAAETAFRFFVKSGWSKAQAAGLLGNIEAESGFNAAAVGDHGAAFGLCQWHGDRQAQFQSAFGHSMRQAAFDEQLAFVNFELRSGNETRAGQLLSAATTAADAGRIVSTHYERPGDVAGSEKKRAALAEKWFDRFGG